MDTKYVQQLEALRQGALKTEALHGITTERRLLASRRRLQLYVQTLSAAWSPWAAGNQQKRCTEPPGWKVSSHKDQRMRQVWRAFSTSTLFLADSTPWIPY